MEPVAVLRLLVQAQGVAETQNQLKRLELEAKNTSRSTDRLGSSFKQAEGHMRSFGNSSKLLSGIGPSILGLSAKVLTLGAGVATLVGGFGGVALGVAAFGSLGLGVGLVAASMKTLIGTAKNMGPLYQAAQGLKKSFQSTFDTAIKPMIGPLRQMFTQLPKMITSLTPLLRGMFSALAGWIKPLMQGINGLAHQLLPQLAAMFRATTPLIKPLIQGVSQFLSGVLGGITKLLQAAGPAIKTFASVLGMLGKDIGSLFSAFAPVIQQSVVLFKAVMSVLGGLLPIIAQLGAMFARALAPAFQAFASVVKSLLPFLKVIGGVFAQLAQAVFTDLTYALKGLATLLKDLAPSFQVLARVAGQFFKVLENSGVFAVLGNALNRLAPLLAQLINTLVKGLAPILPQLIGLISTLAKIVIQLLAMGLKIVIQLFIQALKTVLPPLVQFLKILIPAVAALARTLGTVLVGALKILKPILFGIQSVFKAVSTVIWSGLIAALKAVIGVINGIPGFFKSAFYLVRKYVFDAIVAVLGIFSTLIHAAAQVFDVLSHLPVVGGAFGKLRDAANSTANSIDDFRNHLKALNAQADQTAADTAAKLKFTQARKNVVAATKAVSDNWVALKLNTGGTNQDILNNFTTTWKLVQQRTHSASAVTRDQATHDLNQLKANVAGIMTIMLANVTTQMNNIKGVIDGHSADAAAAAGKNFKTFAHNVWKGVNAGWLTTRQGATLIQGALDAELKAFATSVVPQAKLALKGALNPLGLQRGGIVKAAGGLLQIGRAGARGADNVPLNLGGTAVMAAEGEQIAVLNHHQQGFLNRMLAPLGGLPGFFQKFNRPHAEGGGIPMASGGLASAIGKANWINAQHYPYVWGGGHNSSFTGPYDCSGAVSAVLHAGGWLSSPEVSGALASFGAPGPGPVTVYANTTHTFMSLLGRFFGTHGSSGAGWYAGTPLPGYAVRHPAGPGMNLTIRAPQVDGGGTLGKIAQGVLDKMTKAANAFALSKLPSSSSVAPGPGGPAGYTISQLEGFWTRAHGPASVERIAAAIAMAESGGRNVMQQGQPPGTTGWGLWQITPTSGIPGGPYLLNPGVNAQKAVQLYNQAGGFSPWVTFNDGAYRHWMQRGGLLPPYGGNYAAGGTVPGPLGAPRTIIAHGGEPVGGQPGPLVTIQNMEVRDSFDEQAFAHRLAFLLEL